jgi:hypothetical protein
VSQTIDPLSFRGGHDLMNISLTKHRTAGALQVPGLAGKLAQVVPQQSSSQQASGSEVQPLAGNTDVQDSDSTTTTALSIPDRPVMSQSQPLVDTVSTSYGR